jgi:mono/diheme cytochrome c family protein
MKALFQALSVAGALLMALATADSSAHRKQDPQDFSQNTWELPPDADKTRNPIQASAESIAQGKELFMTRKGNCVFCHGESGAGNQANLPKLRPKPADLSDTTRMPKLSDGEIYWKITRGINGIMPTYDDPKLTQDER